VEYCKYDYLIVGAGLYGSIFAHEATKRGKRCLVIDKRDHIAGNLYNEKVEGINVHKYGAHIFHTSNSKVWKYVNQFAEFHFFINSPMARYRDEIYNLPFNMNTFVQLWGVKTPDEAKAKIAEQKAEYRHITNPKNLEEQALVLGGRDIYEKLIKGYSEKQWGRPATEIPAFIIRRLPFRFTFNNNYFNDRCQGIPIGGYNTIFEKLLDGIEVRLSTDFFVHRKEMESIADKIVYTGKIDEFFEYKFGELEYRSLHFENKVLDTCNYQGNAVVNWTESSVPYTRIIEHKHFEFGEQPKTVITKEYPHEYSLDHEPYYPLNDDLNNKLLDKYKNEAASIQNVIFGGRLAEYKYYDMDDTIESVLEKVEEIFCK